MEFSGTEDRRQDCRAEVPVCLWVDVPLAFSYEPIDPDGIEFSQWQWDELAISPDLVRAMIEDTDQTVRDPLLLQMLTRIDWMLTSVLRTLGKDKNLKGQIPEFTTVNLCASGVRFLSAQSFPVDSYLVLRLILRPFIPVQAVGKILRVDSNENGEETEFTIAVEFTHISSDDREAIIRQVLRTQASMQRLRLQHSAETTVA